MKLRSQAAFTLIELLVVITIIGILAGIALPVFNNVTERAQQTKALASAKQIGLALKLFASDNDGNFPLYKGDPTAGPSTTVKAANSNEAFACLFPGYVNVEKIFWVAKSKWCNAIAPDEQCNTVTNCLAKGENNFAFVTGLNDTSNSQLPLIADGLTASDKTKYTTDPNQQGGVWKGKKAIVIRVDQSGAIENCDTAAVTPTRIPSAGGTAKQSIFTADTNWLDTTANPILNPLTP